MSDDLFAWGDSKLPQQDKGASLPPPAPGCPFRQPDDLDDLPEPAPAPTLDPPPGYKVSPVPPIMGLTPFVPEALTSENEIRAYWWATSGGIWGDWYRSLPSYERDRITLDYTYEVALAGPNSPIRPYEYVKSLDRLALQQNKELAERWAAEIQAAFKDGKPCPIIPVPRNRWVLDWAFQIALVPRDCVQFNPDLQAHEHTEPTPAKPKKKAAR